MRFGRIHHYIMAAAILFTNALAFAIPSLPVSAAGNANVSASGPVQAVSPGSQFTVTILVQPNNSIAGAQASLSFDPSLVTVNSVSEGTLMKQNGANTYFTPGRIDNAAGAITGMAGTITNPGQTVSTPGTLAVITMIARSAKGTCALSLSRVIVGDLSAQSLPTTAIDGSVVIGNGNNRPPAHNTIGNKTVTAGSSLAFTVSATDPDGDPLVYSVLNLPSGASFDPAARTFSWTPTASQAGTYSNIKFEVSDGVLIDFENIAITVAPGQATGGAGGGSGGGGGGGGGGLASGGTTPAPATTSADGATDNNGLFNRKQEYKSEDSAAKLVIEQGTTGFAKDGKAIDKITITAAMQPVVPPFQSNVIGTVYDIGPDGSTFDSPVDLTLAYSRGLIPGGVDENKLVIVTWDALSGAWSELKSTVDPANSTVTAKTNHFSVYCILAHVKPAAFSVKGLSVLPGEIDFKESATVNATITNSGDLRASYEAILKMDGQNIGQQAVLLAGGATQNILFTISPDSSGTHILSIDGLSAKLMVKEAGVVTSNAGPGQMTESPIAASVGEVLINNPAESKALAAQESLEASPVSPQQSVKVISLSLFAEIIGVAAFLIACTISLVLLRRNYLLKRDQR